jgi:uncharacterized protein YbjT (DUF2867 family)
MPEPDIIVVYAGNSLLAPHPSQALLLIEVSLSSLRYRAALDQALAGATNMFWLTPPAYRPGFVEWAGGVARNAATAAKAAGVQHAVLLSSLGAQAKTGLGPVTALALAEDAFHAALTTLTVLRPAFFMENMLRDVDSIKSASAFYNPIPSQLKMPMVATRDIAAKAFDVLLAPAKGFRTVGIHGPADLSHHDVAKAIGDAIGKPVAHVQVTLEQAEQAMLQMGMPDFIVAMFTEMNRAVLSGRMIPAEQRSEQTTTPTTLATFIADTLRPQLM